MKRITIVSLVLIAMGVLAGCEGDDGAVGPQGPPGDQGPPGEPPPPPTATVAGAAQIVASIDSVSVASPPEVNFTLVDGNGQGLTGLPDTAISFTVARLVPGTDGNASEWRNYVTRVEEADGSAPDVLNSASQGATENGSAGDLEDHGDGSYTYTFATDLANVPGINFDDTLTHRVGFEIRGFVPVRNPVYTFRPSDGATSNLFTRKIVETASCNNCHDTLALHGNGRFETDYCVTCHNPGSTDQDTGNIVDFKVMIHKIHRGADLPSVEAGGEYVIYGFGEARHDFSHVEFPQDIRNCRTCHNENNPNTPDAGNWLTAPTMQACGACHDNVNFVTGAGHSPSNLAVTNADCTTCHRDGGFVGPIDESHAILEQIAAEAFQFNIKKIENTAPGEFPKVSFTITDPTNGNARYDIQNDAPFTQGAGASRIAIDIGWSTSDYNNRGSGSATATTGTPGLVVSLNPLFGGATNNGKNLFTITSPTPIPLDVTGSGQVAIEGHPAVDVDDDPDVERLAVTGANAFFAITDAMPTPRRQVVDIANCHVCHQQLSLHGSNRTGNVNLCVACHNPNTTDIDRRPALAEDAVDGLKEQGIDFKRMIHAIHAGGERENPFVVYGFCTPTPCVGSVNDFSEVEFPGHLNDCSNCHVGSTFYPVTGNVLATTIDSGPDRSTPFDDLNITPNAAVCSACHDSVLAMAHMTQNGGAFDAMQTPEGTLISLTQGTVIEGCPVCHGPDRIADIREVHGF